MELVLNFASSLVAQFFVSESIGQVHEEVEELAHDSEPTLRVILIVHRSYRRFQGFCIGE